MVLVVLLGFCVRSQEQITSARLEYFPRLTKFELVCLLAGLVWKNFMTSWCARVHFQSLAIAVVLTLL